MKKFFLLLFISFYVTGCRDFKELRNVSFCFGITIDYDDKNESKYLFTLDTQSAKRAAKKGEFESSTHEVRGDTFAQALTNLAATTTGLINFSHCQVLFLSNKLKVEDLKDLSFYLFYNPIVSNNVVIIMSNEDTANELLKTKSLTDTSASFEIVSALNKNDTYYNFGFKKTLTELYNDLHGQISDFLIPTASAVDTDGEKTTSLKGARLYNNFEFKEFIDNDPLENTLIVTKNLKNFIYNLKTPEKLISLYVDYFKRRSKIEYKDNKFNITYKLKLKVSSSESYDEHGEIKKNMINELKSSIEKNFHEYQEKNIDLYLLNIHLYKNKYKLYKKTISQFNIKDVNFKVDIDMKIRQRGILR